MPPMLGIKATIDKLHSEYPGCMYSIHACRADEKVGKFRSIRVGKRILIDYPSLADYLSGKTHDVKETVIDQSNRIRRIL